MADSVQNSEIQTGDGIHVDAVKTRVECTLQQFEAIAAFGKASTELHEVLFTPDFPHTQLPSLCSAAFSIQFADVKTLLRIVGFKSFSEILKIVRKCGTGPRGDILPVLGTYQFQKDDESRAAIIHVGNSLGTHGESEREEVESEESEGTRYAILTRKSIVLNKIDQRFAHPLGLSYTHSPALGHSYSDIEAFSFNWKRGAELASRL